jgi:hypothetical protein
LKKIFSLILDLFSDEEVQGEAGYDPVHVGIMIVSVLFGISILFWLLWSLMVFRGGIQAKALPFLQMVFTSKTAADFGYVGYPFEMGIFEGWITNAAALFFLMLLLVGIWYVFNYTGTSIPDAGPGMAEKERKEDEN